MPTKLIGKYNLASDFVQLNRTITPKVTLFGSQAKCMVMESGNASDYQVTYDGGGGDNNHGGGDDGSGGDDVGGCGGDDDDDDGDDDDDDDDGDDDDEDSVLSSNQDPGKRCFGILLLTPGIKLFFLEKF